MIKATFTIPVCCVCGKPFTGKQNWERFGDIFFHEGNCYQIAIKRLNRIVSIVFPISFGDYSDNRKLLRSEPKRIPFTFDDRSRITEDEAQEAAEFAGLKLPKIPLCTCGYGGGPSPAHRGDCPMRVWE